MIEPYLVLANRIHQELDELAHVVSRAEPAIVAAKQRPEDQDLYVDAAALNLHDYFGELERIFLQFGATIDGKLPTGPGPKPSLVASEIMTILIYFHLSHYRNFKHYYLEHVDGFGCLLRPKLAVINPDYRFFSAHCCTQRL